VTTSSRTGAGEASAGIYEKSGSIWMLDNVDR
jgi:hypothetical protein